MLPVRQRTPPIFEITLSGLVEASDIEIMKRDLTPAPEAEGKMGLVLLMEDLDDVTGDALIADTRFEMSVLPQWSEVARVALVTDKQAFEALLNWLDPFLPMIEFRTFAPSDASAAESWAADLPKTDAEGPGMSLVEDGLDGLLVFEIDGKMTEEGAGRVCAVFDRAVERHGKINLMVRVDDYEGFDLGLRSGKDTMMSKFGAFGRVGRYAIVGAPGRMRAMIGSLGPLIPIEMGAFDMSEDAAARDGGRAA